MCGGMSDPVITLLDAWGNALVQFHFDVQTGAVLDNPPHVLFGDPAHLILTYVV